MKNNSDVWFLIIAILLGLILCQLCNLSSPRTVVIATSVPTSAATDTPVPTATSTPLPATYNEETTKFNCRGVTYEITTKGPVQTFCSFSTGFKRQGTVVYLKFGAQFGEEGKVFWSRPITISGNITSMFIPISYPTYKCSGIWDPTHFLDGGDDIDFPDELDQKAPQIITCTDGETTITASIYKIVWNP